jgi:hypothetical protein
LANEKIDQVGSFTYLGSIISKDGGSSEDVKITIAKTQEVFSQLKQVWKNRSSIDIHSPNYARNYTKIYSAV